MNSQLEQLLPSFDRPYPAPPTSASPLPPGPGFASGYAPPSQVNPPSLQEQRVAHLEQTAFGSTYPEHEIDDRIEHLEREVFNKASDGDLESRLAKLESKLGGSAFGRSVGGQAGNYRPPVQETPPQATYQPPPQATYQPPPQATYQPPPQATYQPPPQTAYQPPPPAVPPMAPVRSLQPPTPPKTAPPRAQKAPALPVPAAIPAAATALPARQSPIADTDTQSKERDRSEFQTAVASIPFSEKAGDYLSAIQRYPGGTYAHWAKLPITVHVPMSTPQPWKSALEAAIHQWGQYIPLMVASPQQSAEIEIAWINHLQPRQLGITNLEVFDGRMRVTIYLLRPTYYPPGVTEKILPTVIAHEVGHALGLWGHSQSNADIMQALDSLKPKPPVISARDINTLKRVYESPSLPSGFQSPEPVGWAFTHYALLRK